jgi:hypothetical protein
MARLLLAVDVEQTPRDAEPNGYRYKPDDRHTEQITALHAG